jgi:hypothetical protein
MMFATAAIIASLAATSAASSVPENGVWCAEPTTLAEKQSKTLPTDPNLSFRGQFKDFALFVEPHSGDVPLCSVFLDHHAGDDGLWVIEEPNMEALEKTKASILAAGQKVYYQRGLSIVAGGGALLPNITGLDGCGAELGTAIIPVSSHSIKPQVLSTHQQEKWTVGKSNIVANPTIQAAVDDVSEANLSGTVTTLQAINTRNSYSATLHDAEDFVAAALAAYGFTISYQQFRPNMAPNVIATWTPNADAKEWVVAGAHLDSRSEDNQSETDRAPGADDNGTGSAAILEVARLINQTTAVTHKRGLRLCLFTGEEQGLVGSRAIASKWAEEGEDIYAMANADMLGYTSTPEIQQAFMDRSMDPTLTQYAKDLIATYVPTLPTVDTTACCSDQQSFYENGFPSVGFFESGNAATAYPSYHKKTDLLENLSLEQLTLQTQAVAATVFSLLLD